MCFMLLSQWYDFKTNNFVIKKYGTRGTVISDNFGNESLCFVGISYAAKWKKT